MLSGDFRADDLTRVLMFLRDRTFGKDVVKETSNFISHGAERDIGLVTDTARGFFAGVRLHLSLIETKTLDLGDAPHFFPVALRTALKQIDKQQLRRDSGLNRKQAEQTVSSMLAKFSANPRGTLSLEGDLAESELRLLRTLAGWLFATPAFTDDMLIKDLWFVLLKNRLVHPSEEDAFLKLKSTITLFAIASMHGCGIVIDRTMSARLLANCYKDADHSIDVIGIAVCPTIKVPDLRVATAMFSTSLRARDCCEDELLDDIEGWDYPIELSPSLKLTSPFYS